MEKKSILHTAVEQNIFYREFWTPSCALGVFTDDAKRREKKSNNRDCIHTINKITLLSIRKYSDIFISDKRLSAAVWIMI